jgi:hypothetical protein
MILNRAIVSDMQFSEIYVLDWATHKAVKVDKVCREVHPIGLNAERRGDLIRILDGWNGGKYVGELFYVRSER